jgi:hypothetical protein
MNTFHFTIPDRNTNIFRCDVYHDGIFMYHREVHVYNKNNSDELNTAILSKKMANTLSLKESDLYVPVRMAVLLGESKYTQYV